jgi:hypothetical protein
MLGGLKDFRRTTTHHNKPATNFLAAVSLAAVVGYWL